MRTETATHLPSALPNGVAWVPVAAPTAPAPTTKPAPGGLHPAIAAAAILAGAMAIYLGTAAAMDTVQAIRLGNLKTENATLRGQLSTANAAKQAYCSAGGSQ